MIEILVQATIIDEQDKITIQELANVCDCKTDWIISLVEEGILEPDGPSPADWRFSGISIYRTSTAVRIHRDLGIDIAGIGLAIELLEELRELRAKLDVLQVRDD